MTTIPRTMSVLALLTTAILLLPATVPAATRTWNGGTADWYDSTQWSPNGSPAASDTLNVAAGTATLTTGPDLTISGGGAIHLSGTGTIHRSTTHWTRLGQGSAGTYTQTGGTFLNSSTRLFMGLSGGTFTGSVTGGTFSYVSGGDWIIGNDSATGTLTVDGAVVNALNGNFRIGVDNSGAGQGTFALDSGDVNLLWLSVAQGNAGSKGGVTVDGGTMDITNAFRVGLGGTGTYTQTDGAVTANGGQDHFIGLGNRSGTVTITGGSLHMPNGNTRVGVDTMGTLNIGGTADVNLNWLSMAQGNANSDATVTVSGGTLDVNQQIRVGTSGGGTAELIQSGGVIGGTNVRPISVGQGGTTGTYTMTNGQMTTNLLQVGLSASTSDGTFTISNGTATVNGYLYVGRNGATGTVNVDGGTLSITGLDSYLSRDGTGQATFTQTDGTVANSGWFNIGASNGGSGQATIAGGQFTTATLAVGREGYGKMTISNTAAVTTNTLYVGYYAAADGSDLEISGGTLTVNGGSTIGREGDVTVAQSGGTVNFGGAVTIGSAGAGGTVATYTMTGGVVNGPNADVLIGVGGGVGTMTVQDATLSQTGGNFRVGINNTAGGYGQLDLINSDVDLYYLSIAQGNVNSEGHVTMDGGTLDIPQELRVGHNGTGTFLLTDGVVTVGSVIKMADSAGADGTLIQAGGSIGYTAPGRNFLVADGNGTTGLYVMRGGSLSAGTLRDYEDGNSTVRIQGGLGTISIDNYGLDSANAVLNSQVGTTGLTTIAATTSAAMNGSYDADVYGGMALLGQATYDVLTAGAIAGAAGVTVIDDEGLWLTNKNTATTALQIGLDPAAKKGTFALGAGVSGAGTESGWFEITGAAPGQPFGLDVFLAGEGSLDELVAWMQDAGLDATGDEDSQSIRLLGLTAGEVTNFAWDLTDYNEANQTSFRVVGTDTVPEPATMGLLALAVCGMGGYVRRRRRI